MLLNCFRRKDIDEPEQFLAAAAAVLERYDVEIVDYVTALETGIAARQTFPPSLSEVRQACEEQAEQQRRQQRRADAEQQQLAELKAHQAHEAARQQRLTYAELKARHGPNWGLKTAAADDDTRREKTRAAIAEGNRKLLLREYARAGVAPLEAAPGIPVSLELTHSLRGEQTP